MKKNGWLVLSGAVLVLVSRLPFLSAGYGYDADPWRIANTARTIALAQSYVRSRPPGYPVPEIFYASIWQAGPFAFNLASAILSAAAFLFFTYALKKVGCKDALLAGIALALTPIVYINSTTSIDYVWSLAFVMGSLYYALSRKPVVAGLFQGIAIGCRITAGAMLIPLAVVLAFQEKESRLKHLLLFSFTALLVGLVLFAPVIREYGWSFFGFSEYGYPILAAVVKRASLGVWGVWGTLALLVAPFTLFIKPKETSIPASSGGSISLASVLVIAIYGLAYLRLPHQAGYLIPIVPFVILLLGRYLSRKVFIAVCAMLIVSSFAFTINQRRLGLPGPIFEDHTQRLQMIALRDRFIELGSQLDKPSVIVAGYYLPYIEAIVWKDVQGETRYEYLLDDAQLKAYRERNIPVYYLPGMQEFTRQVYGIDLASYGAVLLNTGGG